MFVSELSFYEIDTEPVIIQIEILGDVCNMNLLWFNSKNTSETGCVKQLSNVTAIGKLNRGKTYTLCMMHGNEPSVSPYDCFGISIPKAWNQRALFLNEDLPDIIGISSGALICMTTLI